MPVSGRPRRLGRYCSTDEAARRHEHWPRHLSEPPSYRRQMGIVPGAASLSRVRAKATPCAESRSRRQFGDVDVLDFHRHDFDFRWIKHRPDTKVSCASALWKTMTDSDKAIAILIPALPPE